MRITGGFLKGRTFFPPADHWPTRPTTDISREALFNILSNFLDFEQTIMLDLFGGSGAHGYEMISRGCQQVIYVDKFAPCLKFVKATIKEFEIENEMKLVLSDFEKFINSTELIFDYIFAGPPYQLKNLKDIPDIIFRAGRLSETGFLVLEHNPNYTFTSHPKYWQSRNYGQTYFSFFKA
jgi:16S rRNA (guanine(966)-N(2))-methyltransferase RsmD